MKKKKLIIAFQLCPGDLVAMTAAIRDFMSVYSYKYELAMHCRSPHHYELLKDNPYLSDFSYKYKGTWSSEDESNPNLYEDENGETIPYFRAHIPYIHSSNQVPMHFLAAYVRYFSENIEPFEITATKGDLHLSEEERADTSLLDKLGIEGPFWIMNAGGKYDFTTKWWDPARYQGVVDALKGKIQFVQTGVSSDMHYDLTGVINAIDKTSLRELMQLVYHAEGVVCPITAIMHIAAAIPVRPEPHPQYKPCVVIAGAREPDHWEKYPQHRYLSSNGCVTCNEEGGSCWKSRCQVIDDGEDVINSKENRCPLPVLVRKDLVIPKCLDLITVDHVVDAIYSYYNGGVLSYNE